MAEISFIAPTDQPEGKNRLLSELEKNLTDPFFECFYFTVAFAKISPLLKLKEEIINWKSSKSIISIFGIDQQGTSIEALEFALEYFDKCYVPHIRGKFSATYHPKIYMFYGDSKAIAYVGSNNLTVGGTETNFESYLKIVMTIPQDQGLYEEIINGLERVRQNSIELSSIYLDQLIKEDLVLSEKEMRRKSKRIATVKSKNTEDNPKVSFPFIRTVPPRPLPKKVMLESVKITQQRGNKNNKLEIPVSTLIMHIIPHHNGEVFLSKTAVNQNWDFFGWPFTGKTNPKKESNSSYPQRLPDPIVDISLFNKNGEEIFSIENYSLNTVYYESKAEIRITIPRAIYDNSENYFDGPYPILVMKNDNLNSDSDYDLSIYLPGSKDYKLLDDACNQTMPSGGKKIPRKFGWL